MESLRRFKIGTLINKKRGNVTNRILFSQERNAAASSPLVLAVQKSSQAFVLPACWLVAPPRWEL